MCTLLLASEVKPQVPGAWKLLADGVLTDWKPEESYARRDSDRAAADALEHLNESGYLLARIDSVVFSDQENVLFSTRGTPARVESIRITGIGDQGLGSFGQTMDVRPGERFDRRALENDIQAILMAFERRGFPLVQVVPTVEISGVEGGQPAVTVVLDVIPGETLVLNAVELDGAGRTSNRFAARATNLRVGEILAPYNPAAIRADLEDTGLFETVGEPTIALTDSGAVVRIAVTEAPPGKFDLIVGYLPGSGGREGSFVGNGLLELRNLFGGGREVSLRLVRSPGLASSVDVRVSDPYILGLPFRATGRFEGLNQDSTFSRQRYGLEGGYRVAPGLELVVTTSSEQVEPGVFGSQIVDGRPRVAASSAIFAGAGVRYRRIDRPINPRSGFLVEAIVEQGFRRRTIPEAEGDQPVEPARFQQQRMELNSRVFLPTWQRQALVLGGDARVLLGGRAAGDDENVEYDQGDLYRYGGARTLRGYDEDQFLGRIVGRLLAEYRYQLDRSSFAFLFTDLGYVDRPALVDFEAETDVKPGYGFGIQYSTPLGLVTVTYALNPEVGIGQGKVHAGLSFGL